MSDTKISAMGSASALGGTEAIPGVQSAANVKITINQIATKVLTSPVFVGTAIVRQTGGVAGTDEMQLSHDGTRSYIESKDGRLRILNASGGGFEIYTGGTLLLSVDDSGNLIQNTASYAAFAADVITGNSGSGVFFLRNGSPIKFDPAASGANDAGIKRVTGLVLATTDGSSGLGWMQDAGTTRVTGDLTNATVTMSNMTGLSATLIAGRKYVGELVAWALDSTAVDGLKIDFDGGTATATSFQAGLAGTPIGTTVAVTDSTAIATDITVTTATTGTACYRIPFEIVVNAAGTFIPRFAQVAHTTGTATVKLGTYMRIVDCPN